VSSTARTPEQAAHQAAALAQAATRFWQQNLDRLHQRYPVTFGEYFRLFKDAFQGAIGRSHAPKPDDVVRFAQRTAEAAMAPSIGFSNAYHRPNP
jgi:hypothetical protein